MDNLKYYEAFEKSLIKLHNLGNTISYDISDAVSELCAILNIGCIKTAYYDRENANHLTTCTNTVLYGSEYPDNRTPLEKRYETITGNTVIYYFYHSDEDIPWSAEEKEKLQIFSDILYDYNSRTKAFDTAAMLTFYDFDIKVHNLKYFYRFVNETVHKGKIGTFSAVRFNMKQFTVINQRVGRPNGTKLLAKFIGMIESSLTEEEVICRIGGDNFVMLVKKEHLLPILDRLMGTDICMPELGSEPIRLAASVGVFDIPPEYTVIFHGEIMDSVSTAMAIAKSNFKPEIVYFNQKLLEVRKKQNFISASFDQAIENGEFVVYYQPKVDLQNDFRMAGGEALCRWIKNGEFYSSPGEFIPIFERGYDICTLDFYMLETVCRDLRRWLDLGFDIVNISVNFSRRHLADDNLVKRINDIVDRYRIPHEYIEIELTETTTDVEFKAMKGLIDGLSKAGFSTSVDDFGAGYSSLNLIKNLPWNVLKLDKSLLPERGAENVWQDRIFFKCVVSMAKEMCLECIAEGVETMEQVNILKENNCHLAQGFFFDRALPADEFEKRLRNPIYIR